MKSSVFRRAPVWEHSFSKSCLNLVLTFVISFIAITYAQMSTDPSLCGGYQRMSNGFINFTFNANTAPPGMAMGKKFCMWTISPTVPNERSSYNITIRNVNLDCDNGDKIGINYFTQESTEVSLGVSDPDNPNPLCKVDGVWERKNANATTMVVILYVEQVVHGRGFILEWEEGYDSRITPPPNRVRNTYYSFGKPSVAPNPYFAAGFRQNEISTFGFVKANYTDGYVMDMHFWSISCCEGQDDWRVCYDDTFSIFKLETNGTLSTEKMYLENETNTEVLTSSNGFFIIVKIEDESGAGGGFTMYYETVRG